MKQMATNNIQFQQNVSATIKDLQTQIGKLATTINQLQQQGSGNIPAQPIINPKGNVSGRELPKPTNTSAKIDDSAKKNSAPKQIPLPFPSKSIPAKKVNLDYDLLEKFRRVDVNIPLLDAIKQIPKYARFLKDLSTYKRKLKGNEQVKLCGNVSAIPPCQKSTKILTLLLSLVPFEIALLQMSCSTLEPQLMSCSHQFANHYILVI